MPAYLQRIFEDVNNALDSTASTAAAWASEFTTDTSRERIMHAHRFAREISDRIATARQRTGMAAYAQEQWGQPALDFVNKALEIEAAADAVADFIEANFPSVLSVLNAAMTALSVPSGQQDALRAQIGEGNLAFVLTHRFEENVLVSPVIPATQLTQLVSLLTALAAAATI